MVFVFLQIGERHFEDSPLQCVVCVLETGCPVHERLANIPYLETGWSLCIACEKGIVWGHIAGFADFDGVPVLARKGILRAFLEALFAFG